jgi:DNA-binding response OmpR family regulator
VDLVVRNVIAALPGLRRGRPASCPSSSADRGRVLVVEDEPAIADLIALVVAAEGFSVTQVPNGDAAIDEIRRTSYAALIVDVMLPGKDGYEIVREVRKNPRTAATPVVMVTAMTDDSSTWNGWQAGCDCYITKPFDPDALAATVRRLVRVS